jgi:hypothetical protein
MEVGNDILFRNVGDELQRDCAAPSTFQDLTSAQARFLGTQILWGVTPCRWARVSRRFDES